MHPKPLLPLNLLTVAVLVDHAGGKVTITEAEMASFDRRCELLQYATPEGITLEVRRAPFTVPGEVIEGSRALTPGG